MSWNPSDPRQRFPGASPAAIPGNSTPAMGSPPQHAYYQQYAASPYTTTPSPFAGTPGGFAGGSTPYNQPAYNPSASPYAYNPYQHQHPPQPQAQEYVPEYTGSDPWAMYLELRRTGQLDPYWIAWAENQRAMGQQHGPGGGGVGIGYGEGSTRYQPPPAIGRGPRPYTAAPLYKPPSLRPAGGGGQGASHRRTSQTVTATTVTAAGTGQGHGQGAFTKPDPPPPKAPGPGPTVTPATSNRPQPYVNPERAGLIPGTATTGSSIPVQPGGDPSLPSGAATNLPPKPPISSSTAAPAPAPPATVPSLAAPPSSESKSKSKPTENPSPYPPNVWNSVLSLSEMRQAKSQEYARALQEKRPLNLKGIGLGQGGQGAGAGAGQTQVQVDGQGQGQGRAGGPGPGPEGADGGLADVPPAGGDAAMAGTTASKGLYLDDEDSLIYRVGQRGISNEYLTSILPPQPELPADASPESTWETPIGQVKQFFYAEMVFQLKESRDRDLLEKQKHEVDKMGMNGNGAGHADGITDGHGESNGHAQDWDMDVGGDRPGAWDEAELWPPEECEKDLSDLVV